MRKIFEIARRDFRDTVQAKTFILSFLMVPLIIGFMWYAAKEQTQPKKDAPAKKIAITCLADGLSAEVQTAFKNHNSSDQGRIDIVEVQATGDNVEAVSNEQKDLVRKGKLDLYVVVDKDAVAGKGKIRFYARKFQIADMSMLSTVESLINQAGVNLRCRQKNVPPELYQELRKWIPSKQTSLEDSAGKQPRSKADYLGVYMLPFFFMFMMFMGIFSQGQQIMTSILEEKNSRIIEVLLSAVSPFQLLTGKVVALAGVGLVVMGVWTAAAITTAKWQGMNLDISPQMIVYFILYYVLGFLLITCILAAVGSVCNTIKEAQSLVMPITLLLIVPMASWFSLAQDPQGLYARVLSYIPITMPMVMVLRLAASRSVPMVEVLASFAVLAASVLLVIWAGAKIFRTGILLYGKKPTLGEMFRWLRQR